MRYLSWVLKGIVFLLLLSFALQNTEMVILNTFLDYHWQAPLIFIMLVCFVIGAMFGVIASLTYIFKLRGELNVARKNLTSSYPSVKNPESDVLEPPRDAL